MSHRRREQHRQDALHLIDAQTEGLVLGGILFGGERVLRDVSFLSVDDFAVDRHRIIFKAISDIALEVDLSLTAVCVQLDEAGKLKAAGGVSALMDIHSQAIPALSLQHFALKLRALARDRRAWRLGEKLSVLCQQGFTANCAEVLTVTEELRTIAEAPSREVARGVQSIRAVHEYGDANVQCILEGLLYEGTVNLLTGDSGHEKSTLALAIAAAVATGSDFAGRKTSPRNVLILDRENPQWVIRDRIRRLGIEDGDRLKIWGRWCPEQPPGPDHPDILNWIRTCEVTPLIFFDSLIGFFGGQSENDSAEIRRFMEGFRRLATTGSTVVGLHHSGKGEGTKYYRGSSDYKAACDCGWLVSNNHPDRLENLKLEPWKSRFNTPSEIMLHYSDGQFSEQRRSQTPVVGVTARLTELLKSNPGIKAGAFEKLAGEKRLGRDAARKFLNQGVEAKTIRRDNGDHNSQEHTWVGPDEAM